MNNLSLLRAAATCLLSLTLIFVILFQPRTDQVVLAKVDADILIEKVYADGLALNEPDEAVRLINIGNEDVDLTGWGLSDDSGNLHKLTFPNDSILEAGESIWVTHDGTEFETQFGFMPDYEQTNTIAEVTNMIGSWPGFSNAGDEVILSDSSEQIIDALAYESSDPVALRAAGEWLGSPLQFYSVGAAEGQVFFRKSDPMSGLLLADTNSAADWGQDEADPINGRRVQYPGWEAERFFKPYEITETAMLTVAIAPDNAFEAIATLFDNAKSSILIETHTFASYDLMAHLKQAAERGVEVKLLLEGGPPGGIADTQRWNCHQLALAGAQCFIMQNDKSLRVFDRYTFIHAKFMIIDGKIAVIGSDNLSPNSMPADRKDDGTFGRRGVTLITDASGVVDHLQTIFADDVDQVSHQDILDWVPGVVASPSSYENGITYTVAFPQPSAFTGNFEFEVIQAPENFLNPEHGLFRLLAKAGSGDVVLVQQQYERGYWGADEINDPNLRLNAYLAAARRGSKVEILLDSFFDDPNSLTGNTKTCERLIEIARDEKLDLLCQIGNPTGLGIHNKMVLAQINGRGYVHVGSINGSEQSSKVNREMALQVQSNGAYELLSSMFHKDFIRRVYLPLIYNDYEPPTDQLLISEVLYNPFGASDAAEFIEIVNPSGQPRDISGYSLSDAATPADYADLRRFPAGTILPAHSVLIVTQQAVEFTTQFIIAPNFELLNSDPNIPELVDDPAWGDRSTFLRLGNLGDVVFLRDQFDNVVDVLVYGDKIVPGYPTCPATILAGASLRRNPFNYDTDECLDFEEWGNPTPGQVP